MAMVYYKKKPGKRELTAEEIQMLEDAAKMPPNYDDDCPELTEEMLQALIEARKRKPYVGPIPEDLLLEEKRGAYNVTVSISAQAYEKAKRLHNGDLSFLGDLLNSAIMRESI